MRVDPVFDVFAFKDGGHAVMDLGGSAVGRHGNHGEGMQQDIGFDVEPVFPQAGDVKRFTVCTFDLVGDVALFVILEIGLDADNAVFAAYPFTPQAYGEQGFDAGVFVLAVDVVVISRE